MHPSATTETELKAMKCQCWRPNCPRKAYIRDWKGWKWCGRCWWRQCQEMSLMNWYIEFRYGRFL